MNNNYNEDNQRKQRAIKQAKTAFIVLLVSGLLMGLLVSFGLIKLMNYFGLTEKRNQIEIIKDNIN
ncbi:hypothetical protein VB715_19755 [Crocosphaera sp. UHCC 0190]|uniref:hypothetical protein n=1 Tax=Crocosphaera sp. UHCC 0190 TaxID=3110246 RepID=UPI002B211C8C|nr:hypothetical protein [Crocosphaera sp. UHCC 0190]MEA5512012.1 hypothetical protein [Crocosphaera sp. UHCC 0190]